MPVTRLRVSLVIPAYNEERHLRACLDAVQAQSKRPFEVIVADNNSTDGTASVARTYPFVKVVREARQGRAFARSRGFDAALGDIIARIDADTILPADWVEHIQRFYADTAHKRQAWTSGARFYNVSLRPLVGFAYALLAFYFNKVLLGHYSLWGSSMALTREQWQAVRPNLCLRNDIHEDLDLAMHLAAAGYGITYDPTIRVAAELRRVYENRYELWRYLQWWPRTLRLHHKKTWMICWLFGALGLYLATMVLVLADRLRVMTTGLTQSKERSLKRASSPRLDGTEID